MEFYGSRNVMVEHVFFLHPEQYADDVVRARGHIRSYLSDSQISKIDGGTCMHEVPTAGNSTTT